MAGSVLDIPGNIDLEAKAAMLAQRRAVLLSVVGSTPASSDAVTSVLNDGFLVTITAWLDDILNSVVGGVDLLLHLLDSVSSTCHLAGALKRNEFLLGSLRMFGESL